MIDMAQNELNNLDRWKNPNEKKESRAAQFPKTCHHFQYVHCNSQESDFVGNKVKKIWIV